MREIKFRAWDKELKEYVDINNTVIDTTNGDIIDTCGFDMMGNNRNSILEQYTGLKDKNGVDIYENDVVETTYYNDIDDGLGKIGTIAFEKGGYCIIFVGDTAKNNLGWIEPDETTVIGNVHQNSDLLVDDTDRISPDDIGNDIHDFLHGGDK